MPYPLMYGTAWKKAATTELVLSALNKGFTSIDTANQPKHYSEALVGEALQKWFGDSGDRSKLFIQTKFTPLDGHDHRVPYDRNAPIAQQVRESYLSSLTHLGITKIDSYLLHGPYHFPGLGAEDWEAWGAIETLHQDAKVAHIGVSNVNIQQLTELVERAKVKPMVVQNRCYANRGWDYPVRAFCQKHSITYQGFSLLTANPQVVMDSGVVQIAEKYSTSTDVIVFAFSHQIGIQPLTGTTNESHMEIDLKASQTKLTESEMHYMESHWIHSH